MEEKRLDEKGLENVSGGTEENVRTWFRCIRPSCGYEERLIGRIPEGELRVCPVCHQDSFKSKGIYETENK